MLGLVEDDPGVMEDYLGLMEDDLGLMEDDLGLKEDNLGAMEDDLGTEKCVQISNWAASVQILYLFFTILPFWINEGESRKSLTVNLHFSPHWEVFQPPYFKINKD